MTIITPEDGYIEVSGYQEEPRYYPVDGELYPSVTTVLGIINKVHLNIWRGNIGNEKANEVLRETALFGDRIHDLTAQHDILLGSGMVIDCPPELVPYLTAYSTRVREMVSEVRQVEMVVYSKKYRVAGRLDRVLLIKNEEQDSVWDVKTGTLNGLQHAQTAAYTLAYEEMTGITIGRRGVIQVSRRTGKVRFVDHSDPHDMYGFLRLLEAYQWLSYKGEV